MKRLKLQEIVEISKDKPITTFKKLDFNMISPYQGFEYQINKEYKVDKFNMYINKSCTNNRIYSILKDQLSKWDGLRVFECKIWGKCILEDNDKIGSEYIQISRELDLKEFLEYMDSDWAFWYCKDVKDIEKVRDKITDSGCAYDYCRLIKDRKKIRDKITDSQYSYYYCLNVKDRKEIRDRINDSRYLYLYCKDIKDRKEVRDRIIDSEWAYCYCKYIKDRKEVRDKIMDS